MKGVLVAHPLMMELLMQMSHSRASHISIENFDNRLLVGVEFKIYFNRQYQQEYEDNRKKDCKYQQ